MRWDYPPLDINSVFSDLAEIIIWIIFLSHIIIIIIVNIIIIIIIIIITGMQEAEQNICSGSGQRWHCCQVNLI